MKHAFLSPVLTTAFALFYFLCNANGQTDVRVWSSPDTTHSLRLTVTDRTPTSPGTISLIGEVNRKTFSISEPDFIASRIRREYAGTGWLENTSPRWIDNKYAIFENPGLALCIIDCETGSMLLNTTFEALADSPGGTEWAGIRYRPVTRNQDRLHGGEKDTLFIINLPAMVVAVRDIPNGENGLFRHLKSIVLPGVALAPPFWKAKDNKKRLLVGIWNWSDKQAEVLSFDATTLSLRGKATMNLIVPEAIAYSPWINTGFEPKVLKVLNDTDP